MLANESMTLIRWTNGLTNSSQWYNENHNVYIGVSSVATDKATIKLDSDSSGNKIYIETAADFPTQSGATPTSESLEITKVGDNYKYTISNDGITGTQQDGGDTVSTLVESITRLGYSSSSSSAMAFTKASRLPAAPPFSAQFLT